MNKVESIIIRILCWWDRDKIKKQKERFEARLAADARREGIVQKVRFVILIHAKEERFGWSEDAALEIVENLLPQA